jgi:hypothetical protein
MPKTSVELQPVFDHLRKLLQKQIGKRPVQSDSAENFYVNEIAPDAKGKPIFCCAVKIGSGKVQLHLMPVYTQPSLLSALSPALKKRMQGKSCFNFDQIDTVLFAELEALIRKAVPK